MEMEMELMDYEHLSAEKFYELYSSNSCNEPKTNNSYLSQIYPKAFSKGYHFICKYCQLIPKINFIKKDQIQFYCKCHNSHILIKEIKDYLINCDEDKILRNVKCPKHSKK